MNQTITIIENRIIDNDEAVNKTDINNPVHKFLEIQNQKKLKGNWEPEDVPTYDLPDLH